MILRGENREEKGSEDDVEQLEDEEDDPQGQAARFQLEGKNDKFVHFKKEIFGKSSLPLICGIYVYIAISY